MLCPEWPCTSTTTVPRNYVHHCTTHFAEHYCHSFISIHMYIYIYTQYSFPAAIAVNWRELLSGALFSESVWHALPAAIPKSWSQIFTFLAVLFSFGLAPCLVFHSNLTQGRYGVMARKLNTLTDQKRWWVMSTCPLSYVKLLRFCYPFYPHEPRGIFDTWVGLCGVAMINLELRKRFMEWTKALASDNGCWMPHQKAHVQ